MYKTIKFLPIIIACFVCTTSLAANGQNGFVKTYLDARKEAMNQDKPYIIFFEKKDCGPCASFISNMLSSQKIQEIISDQYVAVRVDIDDFDGYGLMKYYNITKLPSVMIFEPSGKLISKTEQKLNNPSLIQLLSNPHIEQHTKTEEATTDLEKTEEKPTTIEDKNTEFFTIQCGGFSGKENALTLKERLMRIGDADAFIQKDGELYKVFSGKHESKEKAEKSLQLLNDYGYKGFIKVMRDTSNL